MITFSATSTDMNPDLIYNTVTQELDEVEEPYICLECGEEKDYFAAQLDTGYCTVCESKWAATHEIT